ncbi:MULTISPECIES: M56 family metallopeptidase [Paenibacillus]|uniref:Peptidase M56 domain-containing protein n=1 Tax=Paenibacillus artemisiicola TaxID=1172618 RepID=A0ABS3WBV8_9BACL|nr:M56 family metallopeptidase [Paenibacillus artemisiicola]MBO7745791.1 hypothetical protein [Paenibacillus artemisiicola]
MTTLIASAFNWILGTTIMASVLTLIIFVLKAVFKEKINPRLMYLFWALLFFRLIMPWSLVSSFSFLNFMHLETSTSLSILQPVREIPTSAISVINNLSNVERVALSSNSMLQILPYFWMSGTVLLIGMIMLNNIRFMLKIKQLSRVKDNDTLLLLKQCKNLLRIKRDVVLLETNLISSPTLVGVLRPRLLLPQDALHTLSYKELKYVFLHELSHIKRNDILFNWITSIVLTLHWFNPLMWIAYNKMREDQEIACDSQSLSYLSLTESNDYAYTIIKLLENTIFPTRFIQVASISSKKNQLRRRLIMITNNKKSSYRLSFAGIAAVLLLTGCGLTMQKTHEHPVANAQHSGTYSSSSEMLSKDDYKRMSDIIIAVNKGELPVSALKDAEPLLKRNPNYISDKTWAEYKALNK